MVKKWPGMVAQRTFIKEHSLVYRLYNVHGVFLIKSDKKFMILSELWLLTTEIGDQYSENRKLDESNTEIIVM